MKKHLVEWTPQERTELKGIIDANRMAAPAGRLPNNPTADAPCAAKVIGKAKNHFQIWPMQRAIC